jgi:hypothetical protein
VGVFSFIHGGIIMENFALCSESTVELATAMLKVQASLQPAVKDQENSFSRSRYATLNSVMDSCRQALLANGIWLTQYPVAGQEGHLGLVTKIVHAQSGQWQASLLHMPLPKSDPQGYGSAMTYSRRYALSALLGIVTEEDDDGNAASRRQSSPVSHPVQRTPDKLKRPAQEAQETQEAIAPAGSRDAIEAIAAMPKLDGVEYSGGELNGRRLVIAAGKTYNKKKLLAQSGFQWNEQQKIWWRYADAA